MLLQAAPSVGPVLPYSLVMYIDLASCRYITAQCGPEGTGARLVGKK